jgi:hypothetical protein
MSALLLTDPSPLGGGSGSWAWGALILLGAWHGVNPAMGWLFAAALGLQERRGAAAWRALPPLALGHALAVAVALAIAVLLGFALSPRGVRWGVGLLLLGYGAFRLVRRGHPRFGGMRVGARDLTIWSFLMASAHGAGLMVLPVVLGGGGDDGGVAGGWAAVGAHGHGHGPGGLVPGTPAPGILAPGGAEIPAVPDPGISSDLIGASLLSGEGGELLAAVLVHTGAYLAVTGLLAVLVVHWWGLRLLRSLWIDLDRIWAGALMATGVLTLVLGGG